MVGARQSLAGVVPGSLQFKLKAGIWTDISPPGLNLQPHDFTASYGTPWVEVDPTNPSRIYCCADQKGLWVSNNGGFPGSWSLVGGTTTPANSGTTTTYFDSPIAIRVDPNDANHIYVTQGVRGSTQGFWRANDGANFAQPAGYLSVATTLGTRDCTIIEVEQGNFSHILLSSHQGWPGFSNNGFLESNDAGNSWVQHNPRAEWTGGSLGLTILHDLPSGQGHSGRWLVGSDSAGLWLTDDSGGNWTKVSNDGPVHGGHVCFYDSTGRLWAGAGSSVVSSTDNGATWARPASGLPNTPSYYNVCSNGTTLITSPSYTGDNGTGSNKSWYTAPVANPSAWSVLSTDTRAFTDGPFRMQYAAGVLYAACWGAGLLAMKF